MAIKVIWVEYDENFITETPAKTVCAYQLPRHDCSLHLDHNQHKAYHQTVLDYLEEMMGEPNWPCAEERQKAIDANEIWELQWYPDNSVACYRAAAASLQKLLEYVNS